MDFKFEEVIKLEKDITYLVVKRLIDDMLGRYKIDAAIAYVKDRQMLIDETACMRSGESWYLSSY